MRYSQPSGFISDLTVHHTWLPPKTKMPRPRNKENAGLPQRWRRRGDSFYYRVPDSARHYWDNKEEFKLGSSLAEAYATFAQRCGYEGPTHTMSQLCDRYSLEVVTQKAPASQRSNRFSITRIRKVFSSNLIRSIRPMHVYAFRDHVAREKSAKQANLDLEVLSHMFTKAIEWGSIHEHPMTNKKVTKLPVQSRDRYVTDEELIAFITNCLDKKWRLFACLLVWTGRRKAELLNVRYDDLVESGIRFRNVKRMQDAFILNWTPELRALVQATLELPRSKNANHLFHNRRGMPYIKPNGTTSGIDSIWQRAMKKAIESGVLKERFTMHDLRAKRASEMPLAEAQRLLRHTSARITQKVYQRRPGIIEL